MGSSSVSTSFGCVAKVLAHLCIAMSNDAVATLLRAEAFFCIIPSDGHTLNELATGIHSHSAGSPGDAAPIGPTFGGPVFDHGLSQLNRPHPAYRQQTQRPCEVDSCPSTNCVQALSVSTYQSRLMRAYAALPYTSIPSLKKRILCSAHAT